MPQKKVTFVNSDGTEEKLSLEFVKEHKYPFYDWKYYDFTHHDITRCRHCDKKIHRNLLLDGRCLKCHHLEEGSDIIYCTECKHIHAKNKPCNVLKDIDYVDNEVVKFGESVEVNTASSSFSPKWECVRNDIVKKIWQYQSERELPNNIKETLNAFYKQHWKFNHYYYWWDYKIEWDIFYMNTRKLSEVLENHKSLLRDINRQIDTWEKITPYRKYSLVWITPEWLLERAKYDLMWKEKHWFEKPNTFLQNIWIKIDNEENTMSLHYVLSSDLEHKLLAFKSNGRFGSCQKTENRQSYASWAYDAVTNWCNLPILIYKDGSKVPMWRITCRVMYDKSWKEYLLLERLYHDWSLWDNSIRWKMYAKIAYDLKCKWYNVIASNYSAHDSSTYSYLAKFGLSSNTVVEDLVQPLRQIPNGYGYYCDGWTKVYHDDIDWIDWATDYLDKAYLI